jgi:hypothetical protein
VTSVRGAASGSTRRRRRPRGRAAHGQAAPGDDERGEGVLALGGQHEVRRQPEGGAEPPQDADQVELGAAQQLEHQREPRDGDRGAAHRQQPGPLPPPQPQVADDQQRAGVLEQQRDGDRQVLDRHEEAQLRAGHAAIPYTSRVRPLRRSSGPWPRSCSRAGTVRTSAATRTRTVTAAPGVQPASMRLAAKEPDVPKVRLTARPVASPSRRCSAAARSAPVIGYPGMVLAR